MNIAICDDNLIFAQQLHSKVNDYFAKIDRSCQCSVFSKPEALLTADLGSTDILLLDIDMPGMNGIEVARQLRKSYPAIYLVFVTGWIEYAPEGYCVNAFRYLLKQRLDVELARCLDDVREQMSQGQEMIQLAGREVPVEVKLNDITFLSGSSYRMVQAHMSNGQIIECRGKLSDFENELKAKGFLRIQKSYLVNMRHITQIKGYQTYLKNGVKLKTSERNYAQICSDYLIWKGQQL